MYSNFEFLRESREDVDDARPGCLAYINDENIKATVKKTYCKTSNQYYKSY